MQDAERRGELSAQFDVHPNQITQWRPQCLEGVFGAVAPPRRLWRGARVGGEMWAFDRAG